MVAEKSAVETLFGGRSTIVLPVRSDRLEAVWGSGERGRAGSMHPWPVDFAEAPRGERKRRANDYPDLLWFAGITMVFLSLLGFLAVITV